MKDSIFQQVAKVLILLWALTLASPLLAHKDMKLPLSSDGTIERLPDEYQPAILKVSPASSCQNCSTKVTLQIREKAIVFPPCIAKLFDLPDEERLQVSGSWYHDLNLLPPYILIRLPTKWHDFVFFDGHSILIDIDTVSIIRIMEHKVSEDGRRMLAPPIKISSLCSKDEIGQINSVPAN